MLEKINEERWKSVSVPCPDFFTAFEDVLSGNAAPIIAEIGVGVGATTLKICERLQNRGTVHIFDFTDSAEELKSDLANLGFSNILAYGNTRKTLDSYSWSLAQLALGDDRPTFDLVFVDGAHNFIHDAPASLIAAEMTRIGGYILFDDLAWRYCDTQTMNPKTNPTVRSWFTDEQTSTAQVKMICDVFFEGSRRFDRIRELNGVPISDRRALYRKVAD